MDDRVTKLIIWLVNERRVKQGVDYAIMCKYGQTDILCDPIWERAIREGMEYVGLEANVYTLKETR